MANKNGKKGFFGEFKDFITRGNVLDMAVGVIVATAFGKITTALVNNVLMPFIGWIFGGSDMTDVLNITVVPEIKEIIDGVETVTQEAVVIGFGTFVSAIIDFIIIAFIVFCIVKAFNAARAKAEAKKRAEEEAAAAKAAAEAPAPEPSAEEKLLTEIRDLLKEKK
ncbi:MAG: large conductance mechanosensitive channel protein MscL [Ruminococcaceae bacterium]|nr:large conductance mechanosensitive channel protein MscL [Oscillospiraceae bacterium]